MLKSVHARGSKVRGTLHATQGVVVVDFLWVRDLVFHIVDGGGVGGIRGGRGRDRVVVQLEGV